MDRTTKIMAVVAIIAWATLGILLAPKIAGMLPAQKEQRAAAALLRDPSSAQFRNVARHGQAVCGEINGKNGFGAYSGFTRFYAIGDSATIDPKDESKPFTGLPSMTEQFDSSYAVFCN